MGEYWKTRAQRISQGSGTHTQCSSEKDHEDSERFVSEYDRHRVALLTEGANEDWQLELRRYLQDVPADVTRDTDIVGWWSVSNITLNFRAS